MQASKDAQPDGIWKELKEKLPWRETPADEAKREILWQ